MSTPYISFGAASEYRGYACAPAGSSAVPSLVLYQEAWGVDAHIEDLVRRFSAAGYVVLAPDLYGDPSRRPPALARERLQDLQYVINHLPSGALGNPTQLEAAFAAYPHAQAEALRETRTQMMSSLAADRHLQKAKAAVHYLHAQHPRSRGQPVFAVGFCMGGGLAALSAAHDPTLSGAVSFYGSPTPEAVIPALRCPLLACYGADDHRLSDGVPALREQMRSAGKSFEAHVYAHCGHAFFNDQRPSYQPHAARQAFARTLAFLDGLIH